MDNRFHLTLILGRVRAELAPMNIGARAGCAEA